MKLKIYENITSNSSSSINLGVLLFFSLRNEDFIGINLQFSERFF